MKSNILAQWISLVPLALAAGACGTSDETNVYTPAAVATADDIAVTNYEAGLAWATVDTVPVGLLPADVVIMTDATSGMAIATAAAAASGAFTPSGCVTATSSANVVTYVLNDCSGPLGVANASGTFTAAFTPSTTGLQMALAGNNLKINGATLNVKTQGTFTSANSTNTFTAITTSSGTGPNGDSTARSGSYTIAWPVMSSCGTLNANFTDAAQGTSTMINNIAVCRGQCPTSGTAMRTFPNGSITVTYNGTDNLDWKGNNGNTGTVTIHCP